VFNIRTINEISEKGTAPLIKRGCNVSSVEENPDGIIIRSADIRNSEFNPELKAIARAGAGYNNIPVERCTEKGIVVFNSPGANAEGVKEYEMCTLILASRDVIGAVDWVKGISDKGDEIPKLVEKGKSAFGGPELMGKTLGVLGLGATGALVANLGITLGMTVYGYDPYMSVEAAWRLSGSVLRADTPAEIYAVADYISLNIPYTPETAKMINAEAFAKMKDGVRIVNESRAEVVDDEAMTEALISGKVAKYVTDFPNKTIIKAPNVIATPHLGAVTPESEERCAVMAAQQLYDYLANGNIKNSVNFPNVILPRLGKCRICVIHRNVPKMLTGILDLIAERNINVEQMMNKARGDWAYTILDVSEEIGEDVADTIAAINNVIRVRVIK